MTPLCGGEAGSAAEGQGLCAPRRLLPAPPTPPHPREGRLPPSENSEATAQRQAQKVA